MKKRFIVLIAIFAIILPILGFVSGCFINGKCNYKYTNTNEHLKNWMSMIKDDTKINNIVIPGSHDSGSYTMIYMAETQKFDIQKQLELGFRYFDIRITNEDGKYLIFHDIINGVEAEPIIKNFADFLKDNPSEFLILDFQKFKNDSEAKVIELINTYLAPYLVHNESLESDLAFIDSLTLGQVRGKCIVLFGTYVYLDLDYVFPRNNDKCTNKNCALDSKYIEDYHFTTLANLIENGHKDYISSIKSKIETENHKGLFVLQSQLTDHKKIFGPWSRENKIAEETSTINMSTYISYLHLSDDFEYINIIMRDFVNQEKAEIIIRLNYYKHIIKDECDDDFMNIFKVA